VPLLKRIWEFFGWLGAVLGVFLRTHPILTPALILSKATAQITRLLAFFLPLKVLLLVASTGVPRYFQYFIDPEHRNEWVVGLSVAAVVCYLLTLVLDRFSDYCSKVGSSNLLQKSSRLSVIGNQRLIAKRYYGDFSGVAAGLLLVTMFFAIGVYVYPLLFAALAGFLFLQLLATWAALRLVDPAEPVGFGGYVIRRTNAYLGYLEALNFLAVFGFLVADFLLFGGVNILIAILAFLMTRRLLGSLNSVVADSVALRKQRHRIDPLVFLSEKHTRRQPGGQQKLGRYFQVADRQSRLQEILALAGIEDPSTVRSHWLDAAASGRYLFEVYAQNRSGEWVFTGIEQVVSKRHKQVLENEALIVESLGSGALRLADVVHEYEIGDFDCRLMDLAGAVAVSQRDWKSRYQAELTLQFWSLDPNDQLRRVFELSRPYLDERLTPEVLEPLEVAADTVAKERTLEALRENLDEIRGLIGKLPIFPHNRALTPTSVFVNGSHELKVIDWGRWSLEPIGVGLEADLLTPELVRRLHTKLKARDVGGVMPSLSQLRLAARAYAFEELVLSRGRFNEALKLASDMLGDLEMHLSGQNGGLSADVREINA